MLVQWLGERHAFANRMAPDPERRRPLASRVGAAGIRARSVEKNGTIPAIVIGDRSFVSAAYINDQHKKGQRLFKNIRKAVELVARKRGKIFYGELMQSNDMNWQSPPDRTRIGVLLADLSRQSFEENGIFLSSIVHRKSTEPTSPGPGYMPLIEQFAEEYDGVDFDPDEDEADMVQRHMEAVWAHYSKR